MKKNDWKERLNVVYSTNPDFRYETEPVGNTAATLPPEKQNLRVTTDKKHRAGKVVTLVTGFTGTENDLNELGKLLKTKCGTGGAVKDGEIIIQGDLKQRITELLQTAGYSKTKSIG